MNPTSGRTLLATALFLVTAAVSSAARGAEVVVPDAVPVKARLFALADVKLLPGFIKDEQDRNLQYLLQLDPQRFLWNFRKYAHLPTPGKPYGGWEGPDGFCRGHITGHYLSACAEAYSVTGDARFKQKGDSLVAGLAECQKAWGDGYLGAGKQTVFDALERGQPWPPDVFIVPYYVIHKIMAGLLDQYVYCGNRQALEVAEGMAGYFKKRLDNCTPQQIERMFDTRQANPQNEFGGISEALHNLYALTGKKQYLDAAHVFDRGWFLDPLSRGEDDLTRLHSNTHTPQILGAMRHYELTGYEPYRRAALFFWQQTALKRSYVHGGTSGPRPEGKGWRPDSEHWAPPGELAKTLTPGIAESCVCHNMLKVTSKLFTWTAEPQYADFYERAYFNSVLGMQTPKYPGGYIYPCPLSSGSQKKFSTPENDFWCCCGTGMEAFTRLAENVYYHDDQNLWVNLCVASELHWQAKGLTLRQETRFPEEEGTQLRFSAARPVELTLRIHVPYWATSGVTVRLNGQPLEVKTRPSSFLAIRRTWKDGDVLKIAMPMGLHLHPMPDDPKIMALMYGPVVLAGLTAADLTWSGDGQELLSAIKPVAGKPVEFTLALPQGPLRLVPLYRIIDEHYGVYFRLSGKHEKS